MNYSGTKIITVESRLVGDETGTSIAVDLQALERDLEREVNALENQGYEIASVTPITAGNGAYKYGMTAQKGFMSRLMSREQSVSSSYSYGYGFSYTQGFLITAKLIRTGASSTTHKQQKSFEAEE